LIVGGDALLYLDRLSGRFFWNKASVHELYFFATVVVFALVLFQAVPPVW
jgi:hypothetical protein